MTKANNQLALREELLLGRRELSTRFHNLPSRTLEKAQLLVTATRSADAIYYLSAGWACQFREFSASDQAIVDVYLPGNVIGLDAVWWPLPSEKVMSLTSVVVKMVIEAKHALLDLMTCRSAALYIAWFARGTTAAFRPSRRRDFEPRCWWESCYDAARFPRATI